MKVVVAIDSFKGSLSSLQAGEAVREGILRVFPDAAVQVQPVADGGEGTVEALTLGLGGTLRSVCVTGPLGEPREAQYGILPDGTTAVMEMSAAAGLPLVPADRRNPLLTTTFGVGEMIRDAIACGCRDFLIGIGGSATNDGGAGMLQALGFGLLTEDGESIPLGARGLASLACITDDKVLPALKDCRFRIACDVNNPLCGERGASAVFGPQKGATPDMVGQLDAALRQYASVVRLLRPTADPEAPGAGAAGGLGFAFLAMTEAVLESGVRLVLEATGLAEHIREADLVVTGEGRLDGQTIMGKAPIGVAEIAQRYHKPVLAFSGCVTPEARLCNAHGIDAFFPILRDLVTREAMMVPDNARRNLSDTAEQGFRLLALKR